MDKKQSRLADYAPGEQFIYIVYENKGTVHRMAPLENTYEIYYAHTGRLCEQKSLQTQRDRTTRHKYEILYLKRLAIGQ